jgi:hypothetical protein
MLAAKELIPWQRGLHFWRDVLALIDPITACRQTRNLVCG